MKIPLSLGFVAAVIGALMACSSDSGTPRNSTGGTGGTGQVGSAGTSAAGTGSGTGGSSGTGSGGTGSGGTSSGGNLGPALTINADGTVVDAALGINGSALVVTSPQNPAVTLTPSAGKLCVVGSTAPLPAMPAQADYTNNWGFELQIDLNRGAVVGGSADAGAADAGDAGGDAGAATGGQQAVLAWDPKPKNVVGFAFKLTGQDPAIGTEAGVPPQMRLQTLPHGGNSSTDTYCNTLTPKSGTTEQVLFSNVFYQCYNNPPGRAVFADPIPAQFTGGIDNLQWQINSASSLAYQVNFCLSDIQPILGN